MADSARPHGPAASARERFLEALLESATDFAILATDRDGLVTEWNTGAERILGWSSQEMLGQPVDRFFTPEDRARDLPAIEMRRALEAGRAADERLHVRRDGSRFWASGEMMPLRDAGGAHLGFIKILRDRTGQRQAEKARRADAEFLRSILASSGDCIKVLDLDARLVFMSEGGQRVMEVSDFNAIRGCPWPDFWHGAKNADAKAAVAAAKAGGTGRFQGASDTMAGTPRYWDVQVTPILGHDGQPEKLLSISRDITATRRADVALEGSEARWRSVFERLHEGLILGEIIRNPDGEAVDWRYLDVNLAWEDLVGVPRDLAIGRTLRELFPGIEAEWISRFARLVETGEPDTFTRQVGTLGRWYEGYAFRLEAERFAVLFLEITERKRIEDRRLALVELGDRIRDLDDPADLSFAAAAILGRALGVSRAGYGTVDTAAETIAIERDWNAPGIESLAGLLHFRDYGSYIEDLRRGETVVIADAWTDPRTAATAGALAAISARAVVNIPVTEQSGLVALLYLNHATAREWPADELAFVREVAARTRTAIARLSAERDLRALTASLERKVEERTAERDRLWELSENLLVVADYDGRLRRVSPSWTNLLGHSEAALLGTPYAELIHPDDLDMMLAALGRMRASDLPARFESRLLATDGSWRWIAWTLSPEPGGERLNGVGRDVTAEKEAAEMQRHLEEQLRQAQKMEAVGQLTGGLAHDFNNLLAGISGSLELLRARVAQGRLTDLDRYLAAAQGASKRAAALTHRLLAFTRQQTLDPKPTDVNRLVAGMEEMVRRTVGPQVTVEVVTAGGLWATLVDPNQIENALLNLCINARDAMPDGGRLTIETANRWLDQRAARERDLPPGQYVSLCVSDTGTGMTAEVIRRAFDPFFTTKPIGMGTGLGLSMIYGFVRQSGGQARIYSEPGQGTMVCLYLPRHHGEVADADGRGEQAEAPRAGQGETVLVVDDEPTVRMLVTEVLEDLGYTAIEAADGAAGLRVLRSNARVDLLVTDVGLPGGMNGRQVADAGRAARPGLKVLFITGYAENAVVGNGHLDAGMHVLTKPFAMEALASRIKELIAGK